MAAAAAAGARLAFRVELPNELAAVNDQLLLFFHPHAHGGEDEVEVYDPRRRRAFLRRCHVPGLRADDLVLGSRVTLFARQFLVTDYEDDATRRALEVAQERAVALVPGGALGRAWLAVERAGLRVVNAALFTASGDDAAAVSAVTTAPVPARVPVAALDVQGVAAHDALAQLALAPPRPPDGDDAEWLATAADRVGDGQLRALLWGGPHARDDQQQLPCCARAPAPSPAARAVGGTSCVLVLPSAVARRQAGGLLADVQATLCAGGARDADAGGGGGGDDNDEAAVGAPLAVTAVCVMQLTRPQAERFLEVYKGVLRDYLVRACVRASTGAAPRWCAPSVTRRASLPLPLPRPRASLPPPTPVPLPRPRA